MTGLWAAFEFYCSAIRAARTIMKVSLNLLQYTAVSYLSASFSSTAEYHISSYSFLWNYSFLNLKIEENSNSSCKFQFFPLYINWIFASETIQTYLSKETIWGNTINCYNKGISAIRRQAELLRVLESRPGSNLFTLHEIACKFYFLQLKNWGHANLASPRKT